MSTSILRQVTGAARHASRSRTFTSTPTSRKDIVQEFYLKELRAYKPEPIAKDAHVGVVKTFSAPTAPKPPMLPSDMAAELSAYDAAEPTRAVDMKTGTMNNGSVAGSGAEAYLSFLEQDMPKPEAHH